MKAQLYYFDKKKKKEEPLFDKLIRQSQFITRANDSSKTLGNNKIRFLLANFAERLARSKNGEICIDHDFISSITYCKSDQNAKLLAQLADIFEYKYYNFIKFEGQRRSYCYVIKYTETGESRLENPELFYSTCDQFQHRKKSTLSLKEISSGSDKNRTSYKEERDGKEEIEDIPQGYISSISKEEIKNKEESLDHSSDLLAAWSAASHPECSTDESKQEVVANEEVIIQDLALPTSTQPVKSLLTAKQEREQQKAHQTRRQGTVSDEAKPLGATILSLLPKLIPEANSVTNTYQEGGDFQLAVEKSLSCGTLEPVIATEVKAKPEEKPHDLDDGFRQALAEKAERSAIWQGVLSGVTALMGETPDPLSGKMREVTLEDIRVQFGGMNYKVDLVSKLIRLQAKGELWIPAFEMVYAAKFKEAASSVGYRFELVKILEDRK